MLKEGTQVTVQYNKDTPKFGAMEPIKVPERVIIPTRVPGTKDFNVKALDVTSLSVEERNKLEATWSEYQEYVQAQMKTLFTFEDFVHHTATDETPTIKWRTFKIDKLTMV